MNQPCKTKRLHDHQYRCFFELTLQVIGGKWKPIILFHLAQAGVLRFGELKKGMPGITERMLTKQLREMEKDQLIHREIYKQVPPKVEYTLQPMGIKLIPILLAMRQWGSMYESFMDPDGKLLGDEYEKFSPAEIDSAYEVYHQTQLQSLIESDAPCEISASPS